MGKRLISFYFICAIISSINSSNGSKSDVIKLTESNFNKEVVNSADLWLVEFYAPWCGHCKQLAPQWEKAASALKGIVKLGAVDMDVEKNLGGPYNIQGFPTIKFFGMNKQKSTDYNSERSAEAIVKFVLDRINEITRSRLTGTNNSNNSNKSNKSSSSSSNSSSGKKEHKSDKDVIILEDSNFDDIVMNSKDMWLIEFYAPWCGHCKKLEPEWNEAATSLKGKIKVGKVDATVQTQLGNRFQIQGYPTIKIFAPGPKSSSSIQSYDGPRDASSITSIALEKLESYGIIPDVEQLTNENQLKEVCKDRTGVCIIALLPHIVDSSAKHRNEYIEQLKEATKTSKGKPIYYLWAQGADFYDFEEKLHLSFGYPAVLAVNFAKKKYSICRSSFGSENLKSFVSNLLFGKEPLNDIPEIPKLKAVAQWDGNDAKVDENSDL